MTGILRHHPKLLAIAQKQFPIRTVLDIPCGTGRISALMLRQGLAVTCGDISEEMMEVARAKLSGYGPDVLKFARMDIYNIGAESASFHCVTCIRLFQHLASEQRATVLRELARVSRRFVIVNVMYTSTYYRLLRHLRRMLGRYAPRYTSSRQEILKELEFSSLSPVKTIFPQPGYNGNLVLLLEKK